MEHQLNTHDEEIVRLLEEAIVIDAVNRSVIDETFFANARQGGATVLGYTILKSSVDVFSPFGFMESVREIAGLDQIVSENADRLMWVRDVSDIDVAHQTGRVGIYVYFQSPEPLAMQPWRLQLFHMLGLRVLQLTYNQRALTGDGNAERVDGGISDWGEFVIRECNRLGIAVDVSHTGPRTSMEAIETSETPVLITHANARALVDNPRCKSDDVILACVERGGVVGVISLPGFVSEDPSRRSVEGLVDHIAYLSELIGVDHVSLGLDLVTGHEADDFSLLGYKEELHPGIRIDGVQQRIAGLDHIGDMPALTAAMRERGFNDSEIRQILGLNLKRVLTEIWK